MSNSDSILSDHDILSYMYSGPSSTFSRVSHFYLQRKYNSDKIFEDLHFCYPDTKKYTDSIKCIPKISSDIHVFRKILAFVTIPSCLNTSTNNFAYHIIDILYDYLKPCPDI